MKTTTPTKPKTLQDYAQRLNADLKIIQEMMRQYNIPSLCPDKKD